MQALTGSAAGAIAVSEPVDLTAAPPAIPPAATPTPASPLPPAATPTPQVTKAAITFRTTAKRVKLDRRGRFTLRFTATPGLRGTYTVTSVKRGRLKTLRGRFTADRTGTVKLTLRPGKLGKRPLALKLTAISGSTRATHPFTLR